MSTWRDEIINRYLARYREHVEFENRPGGIWPEGRWTAEEAEQEAQRRAVEEFEDNQARWEAQHPPRMSWATPDDLEGPSAAAFDEWRESNGSRNVLFLGPVGTGKSVAAFAFLRHIDACGVWRHQWTSTVKLMERLRPAANDPVTVDTWVQTDALLLDDLGGEKPSEWVAERLFLLLDERWQWKRPTLVTSNLTPKQLREVLGDRSYSRLQDEAIAVTLTGSDRRRKEAA